MPFLQVLSFMIFAKGLLVLMCMLGSQSTVSLSITCLLILTTFEASDSSTRMAQSLLGKRFHGKRLVSNPMPWGTIYIPLCNLSDLSSLVIMGNVMLDVRRGLGANSAVGSLGEVTG